MTFRVHTVRCLSSSNVAFGSRAARPHLAPGRARSRQKGREGKGGSLCLSAATIARSVASNAFPS